MNSVEIVSTTNLIEITFTEFPNTFGTTKISLKKTSVIFLKLDEGDEELGNFEFVGVHLKDGTRFKFSYISVGSSSIMDVDSVDTVVPTDNINLFDMLLALID